MFTGILKNLCDKRKNLEVFGEKTNNNIIVSAIFSCMALAICIFFNITILFTILLTITIILVLTSLFITWLKDKTKNKIIKIVEEELSKGMRALFCHIPNEERVFGVYCWKYDKSEFVFHIEVFSNEFTHDQIVERILPIQNDINYVSDIPLNIYYCIWPGC